MDFTEGKTPYEILELSNGPATTEAEIRKAYKTLALKKHPDKNKGNPNAAAEFGEIEKAYRVLTDTSARGALDDYLSAKAQRKERQSQETDKRRKLREELERREKEASTGRSEEHIARARLQQELERLRKKVEQEQRAAAVQAAQAAAAAAAAGAAGGAGGEGAGGGGEPSAETKAQLRCSLKVSWDPITRDYSPQELRTIFSRHGVVSDVVVRERKAKGSTGRAGRVKATALVVMGSWQEADRAAGAVNGDVGDPLLVVPLLKISPSLTPDDHPSNPTPQPTSTTATPQSHPTSTTPWAASLPPHPYPAPVPTAAQAAGPAFPVLQPSSASRAGGTPASALFPGGSGKPAFAAGVQGAGAASSTFPSGSGGNGAFSTFPAGNASFPSSFPGGTGSASGGANSFPGGPSSFPGGGGAAGLSTSGFGSFMGAGFGGAGGGSGAEDAILLKMKRAAERERQLAAAVAEDGS